MPLPGLAAGDATSFSFEYFAPGGVMAVAAAETGGLVAQGERLRLATYRAWADGL
jgi:hypothetical protein